MRNVFGERTVTTLNVSRVADELQQAAAAVSLTLSEDGGRGETLSVVEKCAVFIYFKAMAKNGRHCPLFYFGVYDRCLFFCVYVICCVSVFGEDISEKAEFLMSAKRRRNKRNGRLGVVQAIVEVGRETPQKKEKRKKHTRQMNVAEWLWW